MEIFFSASSNPVNTEFLTLLKQNCWPESTQGLPRQTNENPSSGSTQGQAESRLKKYLQQKQLHVNKQIHAEVVELVDTQDSGSCARKGVLVRVQSSAPTSYVTYLSHKSYISTK